eukprot:Nitzschia sp. Nitz4//scaffold151_size53849//8079//9248//NITZ4_006713-RA/size53849-processed-gene-0.46-mRNA-1//-1//CDS//3329537114//19//frame0
METSASHLGLGNPSNIQTVHHDWTYPLLLSTIAGASTCLGAAIVFCFSPQAIEKSMPFSLSLAASVMITVSVVSIGPECMEDVFEFHSMERVLVNVSLLLQRLGSFAAGCVGYYLLSRLLALLPDPEKHFGSASSTHPQDQEFLIPKDADPEDPPTKPTLRSDTSGGATSPNIRGAKRRAAAPISSTRSPSSSLRPPVLRASSSLGSVDSDDSPSNDDTQENTKRRIRGETSTKSSKQRSWRVAMLLFVSLLCHNFPEGLAVVASTVESPELGFTVTLGILIHNIPEGIAIAVPCIAARPDAPWLAFWLASVSGLAEPLGAVFALSVLQSTKLALGNVLAGVAGIMCMVAVVELYPEAFRHVHHGNYSGMIWGSFLGIAIMVATELYFP